MQKLVDLSFLVTKMAGDDHGFAESSIAPSSFFSEILLAIKSTITSMGTVIKVKLVSRSFLAATIS